jgi:hypothetical protein
MVPGAFPAGGATGGASELGPDSDRGVVPGAVVGGTSGERRTNPSPGTSGTGSAARLLLASASRRLCISSGETGVGVSWVTRGTCPPGAIVAWDAVMLCA